MAGKHLGKAHQCKESGCSYETDSRAMLIIHEKRVHGK